MAIDYRIDHRRRIVAVTCRGILTGEDLFAYQKEVWSRPKGAGYDELIDARPVERFVQPSGVGMQELAALSAGMGPRSAASKMAIVAVDNLTFGLGRMYEAYRDLEERSTKKVAVFRTLDEALRWLGLDSADEKA
jgi:hypothetical protein